MRLGNARVRENRVMRRWKSMRLDNPRVEAARSEEKVKAGATPGLPFGTPPAINVSSPGFFSVGQGNSHTYHSK